MICILLNSTCRHIFVTKFLKECLTWETYNGRGICYLCNLAPVVMRIVMNAWILLFQIRNALKDETKTRLNKWGNFIETHSIANEDTIFSTFFCFYGALTSYAIIFNVKRREILHIWDRSHCCCVKYSSVILWRTKHKYLHLLKLSYALWGKFQDRSQFFVSLSK